MQLETYRDVDNLRTRFRGSISDMDALGLKSQRELELLVERIQSELVERIVGSIMRELEPHLQSALRTSFRDFAKQNEQNKSDENAT